MFVVAGVSGRTGAVVADGLLRAHRKVRVIARDAGQAAKWRERGAETAVASLDESAGLTRALAGAEGAYLLSPQDMRSQQPIEDGWRIADAIARAVQASGVRHVVMLSSMTARHAEGMGIAQTLHAAETRLTDAPVPITFLRAAYFLENWAPALSAAAAGRLPTFIPADQVIPMVSTRDVGAVATRLLLEGAPPRARDIVELSGPHDYSPRDLAKVVSRLLGRPVEAEDAPLDAVVPLLSSLGASSAFAEQLRRLYQAIAAGRLEPQGQGVRSVRGTVDAATALQDALAAQRST